MDTNVELDKIDIAGEAPLEEPARQYYFMAKARRHLEAQRERLGRPLTAAVTTFGCQMPLTSEIKKTA